MKKCVKIILSGVCDAEGLYTTLQQTVDTGNLEGVVEQTDQDVIELIVNGSKDNVDDCVDAVELAAYAHGEQRKCRVYFAVEPFFKNEDYRGVVRYLRRGALRR